MPTRKQPEKKSRAKTSRPSAEAPGRASKLGPKKLGQPTDRRPGVDREGAPRHATPTLASSPATLGRPLVVAEELLDLVFRDDFHARTIFQFLGLRTVRELEQLRPEQIHERSIQPIRETIDRIRHRLALLNRCLEQDLEFALRVQRTGG